METLKPTKEDLQGLVRQGALLLRGVLKPLAKDPKGEKEGGEWLNKMWVKQAARVVGKLQKRGIDRRKLPKCHALGARPKGYDWSFKGKCRDCALKLTCISAGEVEFQLEVSPDVSDYVVINELSVQQGLAKAERSKVSPTLVRRDPKDTWATGLWSIYPSGMVIPKIYPASPMFARLYRVEVHRSQDRRAWPYFFVTQAYSVREVSDLLGLGWPLSRIERALEADWDLWTFIAANLGPIESTAKGASGHPAHVRSHILNDIKLGNHRRGDPQVWLFWNLRDSRGMQKLSRELRAEGVTQVGGRRVHKKCHSCLSFGSEPSSQSSRYNRSKLRIRRRRGRPKGQTPTHDGTEDSLPVPGSGS